MQKKNGEKFLVFEITASEMAAVNCFYYKGNTLDGQTMP